MNDIAASRDHNPQNTIQVIWLSSLAAIVVYWMIVAFRRKPVVYPLLHPAVTSILCGYAAGGFVFGWLWYRRTVNKVEGLIRRWTLVPADYQAYATLFSELLMGTILSIVSFEAPAIAGLVIVMLGWPNDTPFFCLASISVLGLISFRQRTFPTVFEHLDRLTHLPAAQPR